MRARLCRTLFAVGLAAAFTVAGCGDDGDGAITPTSDADAGATEDTQVPEDTGPSTDAADTAAPPDTTEPDATPDVVEPDATPDVTPDVSTDTGPPPCPDDQTVCLSDNGLADPSLCPNLTDFNCNEGCCVPVFKCTEDAQCATLNGSDECPDTRFDCRCDLDTGGCLQFVCSVDDECEDGESCTSGVCEPAPPASDLLARILTRGGVTTTGASIAIAAEAFVADDPTFIVRGTPIEWASSTPDVATVADGIVTGGATAGTAEITARVVGADTWSPAMLVTNYAALGAGEVRVIVASSNTGAPVEGWALLRSGDGTEAWGALDGGAFLTTELTLPVDVHVFATDHAYVSAYEVDGADTVVMTPPLFRATLSIEEDGEMLPENQELLGEGSIITGVPDYSLYTKTGEIEVGVTSLGISDGVFAFDLPLIIGPDVKRFYHPEAPALFSSGEQQKLPGGVTFAFAGPVLADYWLAGPPGKTTLWSLAGRVASNDPELFPKISEIFDSIDDGINFETLLSALFPLFKTFYSGVNRFVTLDQVAEYPAPVLDSTLTMPLVTQVDISVPTLPTLGENLWADLTLVIGAAITADELLTPLGITASGDKRNKDDTPDGIVDGNPETEDIVEPLDLRMAPAHSGLQGETTELVLFIVAAALDVDGKSEKPESGSAYLVRMEPGEPMVNVSEAPATGFLPISLGTTYGSVDDETNRTLTLAPVAGSDFHRVVFRGANGSQWQVWLPQGIDTVELPDPTAYDDTLADLAGPDGDSLVVNAFELEEGETLDALLAPGGRTLDSLLHVISRTSYISQDN